MSRNSKKQPDESSGITVLQKWAIAAIVAVVLVVMYGLWANRAIAEEATPVPPAEVVAEISEATEEESHVDSFRARLSRAFDYVSEGKTDEILGAKSGELTEREREVSEREAAVEEAQDQLRALREELSAELSTASARAKEITEIQANLLRCVTAAVPPKNG